MKRSSSSPQLFSSRWGLFCFGFLFLPLLLLLVWLRTFGLPSSVKDFILEQVEKHQLLPYPLTVQQVLFDPVRGILLDHVTCFHDRGRQQILVQVDQVRVGIDWFNGWRGKGWIDHASISNATVHFPVGGETALTLTEVSADVLFAGKEVVLRNAQARYFSILLYLRGTLHNEGLPVNRTVPARAEEIASERVLMEKLNGIMREIEADSPIEAQLEFEASTKNLTALRANLEVSSGPLHWKEASVAGVNLHASMRDGIFTLPDLHISLSRGELQASGEWNLSAHRALLQFNSTADFTLLAPILQQPARRLVERLSFPQTTPSLAGHLAINLDRGFHADLQGDLEWHDFIFNGVNMSRLTVPFASDGRRILIPEFTMQGDAGKVIGAFFWDRTGPVPVIKGRLDSELDPTLFKGLFGPGLDAFLASCHFKNGGPHISATATSSDFRTGSWIARGTLGADHFEYKSCFLLSAHSPFHFENSTLDLEDLAVTRPEGVADGRLIYNFSKRTVDLRHVTAHLNIQEVAPIMGPKFTQYTAPYHFTSPPTIKADGLVDLESEKPDLDTDLKVEIESQAPMEWTLFSIPYQFDEPQGTLAFKNRSLQVDMEKCGFYQGQMKGLMTIDLRNQPAKFELDLGLAHVDFEKFMDRSFHYQESTGTMKLITHLTGAIGDLSQLDGTGELTVEDGDITEIPFLGSLTPLIPGLSRADAAHGDFVVNNGIIDTDDLNISSATLALIGNGTYDVVHDQTELDIRVNANGPFGLILFPVSKIFEYHGSGPMKNVKWVPKNF